MKWKCFFIFITFFTLLNATEEIPLSDPIQSGVDPTLLNRIDSVMIQAINDTLIPGGVVLVGRFNHVIYRKAFGVRNLWIKNDRMTTETVFDIASMTKPIATAAAIWKLVEMGKLTLHDPVSLYIPEFSDYTDPRTLQKTTIRIEHLLLHSAGLPPYFVLEALSKKIRPINFKNLMHEIATQTKLYEPGTKFVYSCLGYITLGFIVEKVSGISLNDFTQKYIYQPMGLSSTTYNPPNDWKNRIAPTELKDGRFIWGTVHDPLADTIGGISGNAGLFSTVDDLARFIMMLLNDGSFQNRQIFSPLTVKAYTSLSPAFSSLGRSPGWDVSSDYNAEKGDIFAETGFGHTGFTGTSIWTDKSTGIYLIILTNRVHPYERPNINRLRGQIANLVAAALIKPTLTD